MLLKLFKYDMKKTMKALVIMLIIIAGTTLLGVAAGLLYSATGRYLYGSADLTENGGYMQVASTSEYFIGSGLMQITALLSMVVAQMCQMAPVIGCIGYVITNYKHFRGDVLSDRGYLTLTLPVTAKQILISKLLSSFIGTAALLTVSFIGLTVIGFCSNLSSNSLLDRIDVFGDLASGIFGWSGATPWGIVDMVASAVLLPLLAIAALLYVYLSFYFFTLLGYAVAKRKKAGAGIGFFLGGSYIMYVVTIALFYLSMLLQGFVLNVYAEHTGIYIDSFLSVGILPILLLIAGLEIMMWFVGKWLLDKKIDLL